MFYQRASGQFDVEVIGDFHCGPDHTSPKSFGWSLEIEYPDSALDSRGFLLDNMSFRGYFDGLKLTTDSCELLTLKAAKHFKAIAPHAQSVSVSVEVPGLAIITNKQP